MTTPLVNVNTQKQLKEAYENSYYFIAGVDGIQEYVNGYEGLLAEQNIGRPTRWIITSGAAVNRFAGNIPHPYRDYFQDDLTILMFPLDGLDMSRLAIFKIQMEDRWFDDVIQNMRSQG